MKNKPAIRAQNSVHAEFLERSRLRAERNRVEVVQRMSRKDAQAYKAHLNLIAARVAGFSADRPFPAFLDDPPASRAATKPVPCRVLRRQEEVDLGSQPIALIPSRVISLHPRSDPRQTGVSQSGPRAAWASDEPVLQLRYPSPKLRNRRLGELLPPSAPRELELGDGGPGIRAVRGGLAGLALGEPRRRLRAVYAHPLVSVLHPPVRPFAQQP